MRLNIFLGAAFVISVAANLLIQPVSSKPNFEVLPEMVRTASYKAYSRNPNFQNGATLQLPPANTVARGSTAPRYTSGEQEAVRAGGELTNPFQADNEAALTRGAEVFRIFCQPCHGATGRGDGAVAMRGFPAPPPLNSQNSLAMKDGRLFHVLTHGQKNMPAYAAQISPDDRWKAILHVRSLQRGMQAAAAAAAANSIQEAKQ